MMAFTLMNWFIYSLLAVFGIMIIDFLFTFFKSFWAGTFSPTIVLDYLKDIVYYILPLNIIISMMSIDPTGWVLVIFYFIGAIAVILKYLLNIKGHIFNK